MSDCNDIVDSSLTSDISISINDGPPATWWLSPDIKFFRIESGREISDGQAVINADNYVDVKVHRNDKSLLSGTSDIFVELWVCNSSLLPPSDTSKSRHLFTGTIDIEDPAALSADSSAWLSSIPITKSSVAPKPYPSELNLPGNVKISRDGTRIKWIPDLDDAVQQEGHKCLIARVYQDGLPEPKPDKNCFHVKVDGHVAQHNLEIVKVGSKIKSFMFQIQTAGSDAGLVDVATIRAIADRVPHKSVLNAILPSLNQFPGFRQIDQIAPSHFALNVPDRFFPVTRDNSRPENPGPVRPWKIPFVDRWRYSIRDGFNINRIFSAVFNPKLVLQEAISATKFNIPFNVPRMQLKQSVRVAPNLKLSARLVYMIEQAVPTYEADIKIPLKDVANFNFTAELPENSKSGDAHIFHVMHIDEKQQVIGGLTIVAVTADE